MYQCHNTGGNQDWTLTKTDQIRHHDLCLTLVRYSRGSMVVMKFCDDSDNQKWRQLPGGMLAHARLNLCLDSRYVQDRGITAEICNSALHSQTWRFSSSWNVASNDKSINKIKYQPIKQKRKLVLKNSTSNQTVDKSNKFDIYKLLGIQEATSNIKTNQFAVLMKFNQYTLMHNDNYTDPRVFMKIYQI